MRHVVYQGVLSYSFMSNLSGIGICRKLGKGSLGSSVLLGMEMIIVVQMSFHSISDFRFCPLIYLILQYPQNKRAVMSSNFLK